MYQYCFIFLIPLLCIIIKALKNFVTNHICSDHQIFKEQYFTNLLILMIIIISVNYNHLYPNGFLIQRTVVHGNNKKNYHYI
ncbi:hypothetical protein pb186bvf_007290 [Paramecium bursaria]